MIVATGQMADPAGGKDDRAAAPNPPLTADVRFKSSRRQSGGNSLEAVDACGVSIQAWTKSLNASHGDIGDDGLTSPCGGRGLERDRSALRRLPPALYANRQ